MKRFKVAAAGIAVFISIVYYMNVGGKPVEDLLTAKCRYDTKWLCPDCFPKQTIFCGIFEEEIHYQGGKIPKEAIEEFNRHSIRSDIRYGEDPNVVVNNLNRNKSIECIRDKICEELKTPYYCQVWNIETVRKMLRKNVTDDERLAGAIMCPSKDERALERFVQKFDQPELLTLLLMQTNSQSLMVWLGSQHNLPVPSFVFQGGFTLVEGFEGKPLTKFYRSPIQLKLKIAYGIIDAIVKLNAGVDEFRIYLRSMNPKDIMVNVLPNATVQITFVALDNVVIFNDVNGALTRNKCDHWSPECDCTYRWGENMNLSQLCRLFLENRHRKRGKGFLRFLHLDDTVEEYTHIRHMLQHCLDCKDPNCAKLSVVFTTIQEEITKLLTSS